MVTIGTTLLLVFYLVYVVEAAKAASMNGRWLTGVRDFLVFKGEKFGVLKVVLANDQRIKGRPVGAPFL